MIEPSARLKGIGEYYFSHKLRQIEEMNHAGETVINLGIGSPDLPPHKQVIDKLHEESREDSVHAYQSYKGIPAMREALSRWYSEWYGVDLDPQTQILPLIGSKEGIMHISMTYLDKGDEVLVPNPGYPTYRAASQLAGATCREYLLQESRNWEPDWESLEDMNVEKVKIMWVNYPHMPSGKNGSEELFQKIVDFGLKHKILICHDNPYSFILNERPISLLSIPGAEKCVLELNSLSKSHNLAGWRIGMMAGNAEFIKQVLRFKSNMDSGMFRPLQVAAAAALSLGKDWFVQVNEVYAQRRAQAEEILRKIGCTWDPDQVGLFLWAKIPGQFQDSENFSEHILQNARVFITPGFVFGSGGEKYIRMSLCSKPEQYQAAMKRIEKIL